MTETIANQPGYDKYNTISHDDKGYSRRKIGELFRPGLYNKGLADNDAACDALIDAAYDAYSTTGKISDAKKAFDRLADGYAVQRVPK